MVWSNFAISFKLVGSSEAQGQLFVVVTSPSHNEIVNLSQGREFVEWVLVGLFFIMTEVTNPLRANERADRQITAEGLQTHGRCISVRAQPFMHLQIEQPGILNAPFVIT